MVMMKEVSEVDERKKDVVIDHLMELGIFKINDKQLYQLTIQELMDEYRKHTNA